jgi:flagellar export protein FliJ
MARQTFRFEPLLDWAEQREDQQMRELATLADQERALRQVLLDLERQREREWATLASRNAPFDNESHRVAVSYIQHLTERIELQGEAVQHAHQRVAEARDLLLETLKEKRSLEHLRERDEAEAAREEGRREASRVDDLNMSRHARRSAPGEGGDGRGRPS